MAVTSIAEHHFGCTRALAGAWHRQQKVRAAPAARWLWASQTPMCLVSHNALVPHSEGGGREGAPQGDKGWDHLDDSPQQTGCAGASLTHLTHQTDAGGEVGAETIENGW